MAEEKTMTDKEPDEVGPDTPIWLLAGIIAGELLAVGVVVWHVLTWVLQL